MKTISALLFLCSTTLAMASNVTGEFECTPEGSEVRYEDTFLVKVMSDSKAQIMYKRVLNYRGTVTTTDYEYVRGCSHAKAMTSGSPDFDLMVECSNDGEEGIFELNVKTMTGMINFYMPQIGYGERTLLNLTCQKVK